MRETTAWVIKTPNGRIEYSTIQPTELDCIGCFTDYSRDYWEDIKKQGYTCVKVKIVEI